MTARHPIGQLLDALGVEMELDQGTQHVTEVVVIAKVADLGDEPGTAMAIGWSKGLDWISRRGLMTAGLWMLDQSGACVCTSDDED